MRSGKFIPSEALGTDCQSNPAANRGETVLRLSRCGSWQPDCDTRSLLPSGNLLGIQYAALSAGSRMLAFADGGSAYVLNLDRPQERTQLVSGCRLTALAISDDGLQVATASSKAIQVWNTDGSLLLKVEVPETPAVAQLAPHRMAS